MATRLRRHKKDRTRIGSSPYVLFEPFAAKIKFFAARERCVGPSEFRVIRVWGCRFARYPWAESAAHCESSDQR
jgi:hypothetical protein